MLGTATVAGGSCSTSPWPRAFTTSGRSRPTRPGSRRGVGGLDVTVDVSAPLVPTAPDLVDVSDTGSSDTDELTSDDTPTFSGTGAAESTILLKEGATVLGTGTADENGNWAITSATLGGGDHTITATSIDAAGNESGFADGITVTIDTTAPAVPSVPDLHAGSDTGSSSTDNLTSESSPTFMGTATPGVAITLKDGASVIASGYADDNGDWTLTVLTCRSVHTITTATDAAGNASAPSAGLDVTIASPVPVAVADTLAATEDTPVALAAVDLRQRHDATRRPAACPSRR